MTLDKQTKWQEKAYFWTGRGFQGGRGWVLPHCREILKKKGMRNHLITCFKNVF